MMLSVGGSIPQYFLGLDSASGTWSGIRTLAAFESEFLNFCMCAHT